MGNIRILLQQKIRCLIERSTLWRSALDLRITSQMRYFIHFSQVWQLKTFSRWSWGGGGYFNSWCPVVVHFNCRYNIAPCPKIEELAQKWLVILPGFSDLQSLTFRALPDFSCHPWHQEHTPRSGRLWNALTRLGTSSRKSVLFPVTPKSGRQTTSKNGSAGLKWSSSSASPLTQSTSSFLTSRWVFSF